jgi:hypothetical protein
VRVWLAGKQEVGVLSKHPLAMPLVAIQMVAQIGDAPRRIVRTPPVKPAIGCRPFAILLEMTILELNKLGRQCNHILLAGRHQHGRDRDVTIRALLFLSVDCLQLGQGIFSNEKSPSR